MSPDRFHRIALRQAVDLNRTDVFGDGTVSHLFPIVGKKGKLGVSQGPGTVAFTLNGKPLWVIDIHRFGGQPTIVAQGTVAHGFRVELKGARFPGTVLPADFVLVLKPTSLFGTPMELKFTLGGFDAQGVFEDWLTGASPARSAVTLKTDVCLLGAGSKAAVDGDAQAWFWPTWLFVFVGTDLLSVSGLGADLLAHRFRLGLMPINAPSVLAQPKARRSLIRFAADDHVWKLLPQVLDLSIGKLVGSDGLFDAALLEAGEGAAGDAARALVLGSGHDDRLTLDVSDVNDLDGKPFALGLSRVQYAIAFDPTSDHSQGDQTTLMANFRLPPVWASVEGVAVFLGDRPGVRPFEVDTLKGVETSIRCEPELLAAAVPLASGGDPVATLPRGLPAGTILPIVAAPGALPGWGLLARAPAAGQPRLSLPGLHTTVVRPHDLLALDFSFENLACEAGGGVAPRLAVKDPKLPAVIIARLDSPQNIAEQAFWEVDPPGVSESVTAAPVRAAAAGPSRLAFRLPAGTSVVTYELKALLDWVKLTPNLVDVALPDPGAQAAVAGANPEGLIITPIPLPPILFGGPPIREPKPDETAIEAPWRVFLSPDPTGAWAHSTPAVTLQGRTELWHTRLATRADTPDGPTVDEGPSRHVRAVWSPDYTPGKAPAPATTFPPPEFRASLDANDRDQIVRLSSDFTLFGYTPRAVRADALALSTLGAWLDLVGDFDPPIFEGSPFDLLEWRHRGTLGRDHYVKVVHAGYLVAPANRAAYVEVTERKFEADPSGRTTAYLRKRGFVVVRQPRISYDYVPDKGRRKLPFRSLRITTLVTPNLDPPADKNAFWPTVGGVPVPFHIVVEDHEGKTAEFTTPLFFVALNGNYSAAVTAWNGSATKTLAMGGQKVAFAPVAKSGDTTFPTASMTLSAVLLNGGEPPFYPAMDSASVSVAAVEQITGKPGAPVAVEYFADYVNNDFGTGGVFLGIQGGPIGANFHGDRSGGVATPSMSVSALSRRFGTVSGDATKVAAGTFDPKDFFKSLDAQLFGVIPLSDLIAGIFGDGTVPALQTQRLPNAVRTALEWNPHVQNIDVPAPPATPLVSLKFNDLANALSLKAEIIAPLDGSAPTTTVTGGLSGFQISLAGVVAINFDGFTFTAGSGKKLDVSAKLPKSPLTFIGDLRFLNDLRQYIPDNGFEDPPSLDVTPEGVTAGYSLAIPAIGVGVFSIENIRLGAALTLPFVPPNPLRFRFSFSERDHPFLITVSLLGGGGFFALCVGPDGIEMLEASIEVGANVSIDVVVASGNVHIMAGVYLKLDLKSTSSQLTGYLRAGGSLDVLGLISASVEFYLGFTYYFGPPCKIAGEATVTIEVHVLFFSASVHASLRREFSDPLISFAALMGPDDWNDYCDAFAA